MFFNNYYPYYNTNYNKNYFNNNIRPIFNNTNSQKKDIEPENSDTIPFKNLEQSEKQTPPPQDRQNKFNLFGFSFEIDDLILIGLIILLFLESDKNYALIIILGLILLNVNLSDIFNIF